MYLREARVVNDGPIEDASLTLEFRDDLPQPLVIVGVNGSGKSNLLSILADAIVEGASQHHSDIVAESTGISRQWLRLVGGVTVRRGTDGGFSLLRFEDSGTSQVYAQKGGHFPVSELPDDLGPQLRAGATWNDDGGHKKFPLGEAESRRIYSGGAYAYFPASRSETPHWLNIESLPSRSFAGRVRIEGRLGKQLYVEHGVSTFAEWLPGLILDSRPRVIPAAPGSGSQWATVNNDFIIYRSSKEMADRILSIILDDPQATFVWSNRFEGLQYRAHDGTQLPLHALSSGQATLLSIFGTLLLQCDAVAPSAPAKATGLCIVDEIDAHVHVDLAYRAIPELIALFPAVQFITTAHSPLFVLGMRNRFGDQGMQVIEMPTGRSIPAEGYREFESALNVLRETEGFDAVVAEQMKAQSTPLVLCEGETDPKYISTAAELTGSNDLLAIAAIDWIGSASSSGGSGGSAVGSGKDQLWRAWQLLSANANLVARPVMFLFDNDAKRGSMDLGTIALRTVPSNPENLEFVDGIENLLPSEAFTDDLYSSQVIDDKRGTKGEIRKLNKVRMCEVVCSERRDPNDFRGFDPLLGLIRDWLTTLGYLSDGAAEATLSDDSAEQGERGPDASSGTDEQREVEG